jgi:hypothetical protein
MVAQGLSARDICPVDVYGVAKWLVDLIAPMGDVEGIT